jgi:hypothetical protein
MASTCSWSLVHEWVGGYPERNWPTRAFPIVWAWVASALFKRNQAGRRHIFKQKHSRLLPIYVLTDTTSR